MLILVVGCKKSVDPEDLTCNPPYMKMGTSCCLDQNSNNICDADDVKAEAVVTCGDNTCQPSEDCSKCPVDCGECEPVVTTREMAVQKIEEEYKSDWAKIVDGFGCDLKYLNTAKGIVFSARISNSKNTIDCKKGTAFLTVKKNIDFFITEKDNIHSGIDEGDGVGIDKNLQMYYSWMEFCEQDMIDTTSLILKGTQNPSDLPIGLDSTCEKCDDVWLVHLQCPVKDHLVDVSSFETVVVDALTGKVYS